MPKQHMVGMLTNLFILVISALCLAYHKHKLCFLSHYGFVYLFYL